MLPPIVWWFSLTPTDPRSQAFKLIRRRVRCLWFPPSTIHCNSQPRLSPPCRSGNVPTEPHVQVYVKIGSGKVVPLSVVLSDKTEDVKRKVRCE